MSVLAVVAAVDRCNSDDLTFKGLSMGRRPQSPTGELVRGKGSENCEIGRSVATETKWRFRKSPGLGVGQDQLHVEVAEARRPSHYLGQVRREFRRRGIALLFHRFFIRRELNYRNVSSGAIAVLRDR